MKDVDAILAYADLPSKCQTATTIWRLRAEEPGQVENRPNRLVCLHLPRGLFYVGSRVPRILAFRANPKYLLLDATISHLH